MTAATLFDLATEAPAHRRLRQHPTAPDPSIMPLRDPRGALRQQLKAWARRPPSPLATSLARLALETAGRLFAEHGMRARWALCAPAIAETMSPQLRQRVDQILRAAGLEAVVDEELFGWVERP